jgi:SAM-dependent methyltransferase
MSGYDEATYGDAIAEIYDAWYASLDAEAAVALLAELAGPGPALELGIGSGRVALPLVRRGIEVHGIEASEAMVAKLRAKPDGDGIPVTIGDFADVPMEGEYSLVYIPFNTLFCLLTQEDQLRCFQNVAAVLAADGVFVVEAFVPDLSRFDREQRLAVEGYEPDGIRIEASKHDRMNQRVESRHVVITEDRIKFYPLQIRYAYPSEVDLMARIAGLRLRQRWGGWRREDFTAASMSHVSLYERAR